MNAQNPETTSTPQVKRSLRNPLARDTTTEASAKISTIKSKVKTGLAVVGVVALAGVVAGKIAKTKGVEGVTATLPTVDVNSDAS